MGSRQEGRGRRRSGLLKGLVIITGEMSHWGMEQPSFQPTYPSDCGEHAKDTHNFLFFFFFGWRILDNRSVGSVRRRESLRGLRILPWFWEIRMHGRQGGTTGEPRNMEKHSHSGLLANIPSWVLRMVELLNLIALKKVTRVQGEDSGFTALFIKKPVTGLDPPGLVGRRQKPLLSQH